MKEKKEKESRSAFSLIELLTAIAVLAILASMILHVVGNIRERAMTSKSMANIRQLVTANYACVAETGRFAKSENLADSKRWHGKKVSGEWVGYGGYLTDYLGEDRQVRKCPVFEQILKEDEGAQFDEGTGGYGYNSVYLGNDPLYRGETGGSAGWWDVPTISQNPANRPSELIDPANTVMFTSTALVRGGGVVETYMSAPYHSLVNSNLDETLTPTTHFRFNGKALVAWCDGHVTLEPPNDAYTGWNAYGDNNDKYRVGWFGPTDNNGYWNPHYKLGKAY